jgi:hypothetical protein
MAVSRALSPFMRSSLGEYTSTTKILSAIHRDGHGGSLLSLGASG